MAENTNIEWAHHTINFWWGCEKIAAECAHCYAATMAARVGKHWGKSAPRYKTSDKMWRSAIKLNAEAEKARTPQRVFTNSMADFFESDHKGPVLDFQAAKQLWRTGDGRKPFEALPLGQPSYYKAVTMTDLRREAIKIIDATPWLDWLILTKRPENIAAMLNAVDERPAGSLQKRRRNVWLGTTAGTSETLNKATPHLLKCGHLCEHLFCSAEPLLGGVNFKQVHIPMMGNDCPEDRDFGGFTFWDALTGFRTHKCGGWTDDPPKRLSWVITGGESGGGFRPMDNAWVAKITHDCVAAGVAVFNKQGAGAFPGRQYGLPEHLWSFKQFPATWDRAELLQPAA